MKFFAVGCMWWKKGNDPKLRVFCIQAENGECAKNIGDRWLNECHPDYIHNVQVNSHRPRFID